VSHFQGAFKHESTPAKVHFGAGAIQQLASNVAALGCKRALILSMPNQSHEALRAASYLGPLAAGIYASAVERTPSKAANDAIAHLHQTEADCTVAIGGGSVIGLSKAIALRTDVHQIVVPTTYSGSEVTPLHNQTENDRGTILVDAKILPEVVIYDPELTLDLPLRTTVSSAISAMAHAVEALYARNRTPISSMMAQEGLRAFATALPILVADPKNETARSEALYGAWLCGSVLGQVEMALHHKLCDVISHAFARPHALAHAVILPHAIAYNEAATRVQLVPVCEALGGTSASDALAAFVRKVGAPSNLKELGLVESDLDRATALVQSDVFWNPEEITPAGIRLVLQRAWEGLPVAG
jgi:maleylacetate reductase